MRRGFDKNSATAVLVEEGISLRSAVVIARWISRESAEKGIER